MKQMSTCENEINYLPSLQPEARVLCTGLRAMCTEAPKPPKATQPKPAPPSKAAPPSKPAPEPATLKYTSAATPVPPSQRMFVIYVFEQGRYCVVSLRLYMKGKSLLDRI